MYYDKAKILINELRSGKYKQGHGFLRDLKDNYCCLGVACEIAGVKAEKDKSITSVYSYEGHTSYLPKSVINYFGFNNNQAANTKDVSFSQRNSLAIMNDTKVSFNDIADYIEKNWQDL